MLLSAHKLFSLLKGGKFLALLNTSFYKFTHALVYSFNEGFNFF
jgi:hypothetical protein